MAAGLSEIKKRKPGPLLLSCYQNESDDALCGPKFAICPFWGYKVKQLPANNGRYNEK